MAERVGFVLLRATRFGGISSCRRATLHVTCRAEAQGEPVDALPVPHPGPGLDRWRGRPPEHEHDRLDGRVDSGWMERNPASALKATKVPCPSPSTMTLGRACGHRCFPSADFQLLARIGFGSALSVWKCRVESASPEASRSCSAETTCSARAGSNTCVSSLRGLPIITLRAARAQGAGDARSSPAGRRGPLGRGDLPREVDRRVGTRAAAPSR